MPIRHRPKLKDNMNKNERWAIPLTVVLLLLLCNTESASAHLSSSLSFSAPEGISSEPGNSEALQEGNMLLEVAGESLLQESQLSGSSAANAVRPVNALAFSPGVYVSADLLNSKIGLDLMHIMKFESIRRAVFDSGKNLFIHDSSKEPELERYVSLSTGEEQYIRIIPLETVMSADAYFVEMGSVGVIGINGIEKDNSKLLPILFHEMLHVVQWNSGLVSGGAYNLASIDSRDFSMDSLFSAMNWVQSEIKAHRGTAAYIDFLLSLPQEMRAEHFSILSLDEATLLLQKQEELGKAAWYEAEQMKILDELLKRSASI